MRYAIIYLVIALTIGPAASFAVPVSAKTCDESGFGEEEANCRWSCNGGWIIKVSASVDDNGAITGKADCGGAIAECVGTGFCSKESPEPTSVGAIGTCTATGDGGWWTHVSVTCSHVRKEGSGADTPDVLDEIIQNWSVPQEDPSSGPGSEVHGPVSATIEVAFGVATGYLCDQGTGVCKIAPVDCDFDAEPWHCVL